MTDIEKLQDLSPLKYSYKLSSNGFLCEISVDMYNT